MTPDIDQAGTIDYTTWSNDIRLNSEPSLTIRTAVINVLTEFRVHPITGNVGQSHVVIEPHLNLLNAEGLRQDDFVERSTKLIALLLGREVDVQQQTNSATILLVYSVVRPSTTPNPA